VETTGPFLAADKLVKQGIDALKGKLK